MFTNIDAQIQAGNPPDVFRVPYYTFGAYAGRRPAARPQPPPARRLRRPVHPAGLGGGAERAPPYGVPHHTDTSVILYNKDALDAAGIDEVPTTLEEAWTWERVRRRSPRPCARASPSSKYPFAYNWQGNGVTRWLSWLFEADGRFLAEDLITPAIDSDAGRQAVEFTPASSPSPSCRRTTRSSRRPTPPTPGTPRPSP